MHETADKPHRSTHLYDLPIVERMDELGVPGVSVAVIDGGRIADQHVYGVRKAGQADQVRVHTRFQACSISKPVTALAMLRLVERGRLDLDADVNDHLTSWRVPANGGWQPRVTLRQIVSHSAGLTAHGFPGYQRDRTLPTLVEILSGTDPANTEGVRVDIVPGLQFRYSGGGTTVLQLLLEEVTGIPVAELLDELVLGPLSMEHSTYEQPLPEQLHAQAAAGHHSDASPVVGDWHVYPEQSAAGLWTTPTDLAKFAIAVQQAVNGAVGSLVSTATAEEMLTPQTPPAPAAERIGGLNAVGLGPFVRFEGGRTSYFGHSGGNEGFRCHLMAHRDHRIGAAVMTNGDWGSRLVLEAFDAIAHEHGWPDYASESFDEVPPRGSDLDVFTGAYALPSGQRLEISRTGDRLDVVVGDQRPVAFSAVDASTLGSQSVDTTVTRSEDGVVLHQSGSDVPARRARS